MNKKFWISIFFLFIISFIIFMVLKSSKNIHASNSLIINIGPISKTVFEYPEKSWIFDLPIQIQNFDIKPIYIPNPLDYYMSYVCLQFFLITPADKIITNEKFSLIPKLSKKSWIKLEAKETINFSKSIIILEDGIKLPTKEEEQKYDFLIILKDKIPEKYELYTTFTYNNQHVEWQQKWLGMVQKTTDNLQTSKFWCGKIESNYLILNLENLEARTDHNKNEK